MVLARDGLLRQKTKKDTQLLKNEITQEMLKVLKSGVF